LDASRSNQFELARATSSISARLLDDSISQKVLGAVIAHIGKVKLHTEALRSQLKQLQTDFHSFAILLQSNCSDSTFPLLELLCCVWDPRFCGPYNPDLEGVPGGPWVLVDQSVQAYNRQRRQSSSLCISAKIPLT
jgi:hypothetical protein